jgi:hypothetical protein
MAPGNPVRVPSQRSDVGDAGLDEEAADPQRAGQKEAEPLRAPWNRKRRAEAGRTSRDRQAEHRTRNAEPRRTAPGRPGGLP